MDIVIGVVILGVISWTLKQGFNMIDERLKDINETLKKINQSNT